MFNARYDIKFFCFKMLKKVLTWVPDLQASILLSGFFRGRKYRNTLVTGRIKVFVSFSRTLAHGRGTCCCNLLQNLFYFCVILVLFVISSLWSTVSIYLHHLFLVFFVFAISCSYCLCVGFVQERSPVFPFGRGYAKELRLMLIVQDLLWLCTTSVDGGVKIWDANTGAVQSGRLGGRLKVWIIAILKEI